MNFTILPNLIALAVLVVVFWAVSRKTITERLSLWLAGWVLVLLHFTAKFLSGGGAVRSMLAEMVAVDLLLLAGATFLISVSAVASSAKRQLTLALCIAVPAMAYASGAVAGVTSKNYYYVFLAAEFLVLVVACRRLALQSKLPMVGVLAAASFAIGVTVSAVSYGNAKFGIGIILAMLNFAVAVLYASCYRRTTAGVVITVTGFALWGAAFPLAIRLRMLAEGFRPESEAWNIPIYLVAVGMMLTLFEDQIEISKYHAYHDELTGLPNRRLLEDRLGLALAYARRSKAKLAVLQLDLDRFKEVNDTHGHRFGDLVLQEVATRLAACIRSGDTLARSGGDEFTVITPVADRQAAEPLIRALMGTLTASIVVDGREVQTGLSIGIALYPDDGINADQLHAAADHAMYAVKRAGRGVQSDALLTQATWGD
ncbi:MAG TPA: GGDEF domain-containing protein [Terriglobales bacterium]|nr:GGDEF domain-containing protein [Terriglobales bacterium]